MHLAHISELRYGNKLAEKMVYPEGSVITQSSLDTLRKKNVSYVWVEDNVDTKNIWERFKAGYKDAVLDLFGITLDKTVLIPDTLMQMLISDTVTLKHSINVASISMYISNILGLQETQVDDIVIAALLHDIGKLQIPKGIINKNGKLTDDEFAVMKTHSEIGHDILKQYNDINDNIVRGVSEHHERWDGKGYYKGLQSYDIHLYARIIAIADVFDALVSERSYKPRYSIEEAIKILQDDVGHFDEVILHRFIDDIANTPLEEIAYGKRL